MLGSRIPLSESGATRAKDDSSLALAVDHEGLHSLRPLHSRCDAFRSNWVLARRGKGYQAGMRLIRICDGEFILRFLRECHGFRVPDRGADNKPLSAPNWDRGRR